MKLIHLSDLHLGKRLNGFSLLGDQKDILEQIVQKIEQEKPEAVMISGDIYDKSIPGVEAVQLLDDFLNQLAQQNMKVLIISGNHDSPERMAFGAQLMKNSNVYISSVYQGKEVDSVDLEDEFGPVHVYMLPFLKPLDVRRYFPEEEIKTYDDALKIVLQNIPVHTEERNILMAHQFVTGAVSCDSEQISIGGLDQIAAEHFKDFDYVALGHIHNPQYVQRKTIRYCGTPLKYSFSEMNHQKSVTVLEMEEKGQIKIRIFPLEPTRELREIRGTFQEIIKNADKSEDYIRIVLTDEGIISDAVRRLRDFYPHIMVLEYDNARTREQRKIQSIAEPEKKTPLELFAELYEQQNNSKMSKEQEEFLSEMIGEIWEETK